MKSQHSKVFFFFLSILLISMVGTVSAANGADGKAGVLGLGVKTSFPYAELDEKAKTGWGVVGIVDYPLIPFIDLTADLGYNHFPGEDDNPDVDVWNICFGGRFVLGAFFMGGETGYFSHVQEWSYVPSMGLRFGAFEGAIRYKAVGGASWTSLRFGYYF